MQATLVGLRACKHYTECDANSAQWHVIATPAWAHAHRTAIARDPSIVVHQGAVGSNEADILELCAEHDASMAHRALARTEIIVAIAPVEVLTSQVAKWIHMSDHDRPTDPGAVACVARCEVETITEVVSVHADPGARPHNRTRADPGTVRPHSRIRKRISLAFTGTLPKARLDTICIESAYAFRYGRARMTAVLGVPFGVQVHSDDGELVGSVMFSQRFQLTEKLCPGVAALTLLVFVTSVLRVPVHHEVSAWVAQHWHARLGIAFCDDLRREGQHAWSKLYIIAGATHQHA